MDWRHALIIVGWSSFLFNPPASCANLHRSTQHLRSERKAIASFLDASPGFGGGFDDAVNSNAQFQSDIANFRNSLNQPVISGELQGIQAKLHGNFQSSLGPRNKIPDTFVDRERIRENPQVAFRPQQQNSNAQFTAFNQDKIRLNTKQKSSPSFSQQNSPPLFTQQNVPPAFTSFNTGKSRPSQSLKPLNNGGNFQSFELGTKLTPNRPGPPPLIRAPPPRFTPPSSPQINTHINVNSQNRPRTPEESFSVFSDKEVILPGQRNKDALPPRQQNNFPSQPRPQIPVEFEPEFPKVEEEPEQVEITFENDIPEIDLRIAPQTTERVLPQPLLPNPVDLSQSSQSFQVEDPFINGDIVVGFDVIDLSNINLANRPVQSTSQEPDPAFLEPVPAVPGLLQQLELMEEVFENIDMNLPEDSEKNSLAIQEFLI